MFRAQASFKRIGEARTVTPRNLGLVTQSENYFECPLSRGGVSESARAQQSGGTRGASARELQRVKGSFPARARAIKWQKKAEEAAAALAAPATEEEIKKRRAAEE